MKYRFLKITTQHKVISAILIICMLILSLNTKIFASPISETDEEAMIKMQEKACEAHEKLLQIIDPDEKREYPDYYAGDYIEGRILHILLTDERYIEYYRSLLDEYDIVEFGIVPHSRKELMTKAKEWYEKYDGLYDLVGYSFDVKENKGKLLVLEKDYETIKKMIIDEDMIIRPSTGVQTQSSVIAGSELNYDITLAGSGTYNGASAFLTCGHNLTTGQSVTHLGTTIGTVNVKVFGYHTTGDYSIITAASGYTPTSSVYTTTTGYTTYYNGSMGTPAVGTYLHKYGRMTGQAYLKITDDSLTVNNIYHMEEAKIITGSSLAGDSGGPYRVGQKFCGVHHGISLDGQYCYFTPYSTIHSAGFTIKIN